MKAEIHFLNKIYNAATITSILNFAIDNGLEIYFVSNLTGIPQPVTPVQLLGIKKFGGVSTLLETGQSYQIGLDIPKNPKGTYQDITIDDLFVNSETLEIITNEFGSGSKF